MNYNDIYLIKLLKASIYDNVPEPFEKPLNWQYIYDKSVEQNISGLIYNSVKKTAIDIDIEIDQKWKNSTMTSFMYSIRQFTEFENMRKLLNSEYIPFSALKGCVLRNFYPIPELRTMGDFDILIKKEQLTDVKRIFSEKGYSIQNDYTGIVCSKNNIVWEIFYSLEEEFRENTDYWDQLFMKNTTINNNISCPDATLFFLHLIVHTGKHFISEGAGVRNLCDISLFLNKYKQDIDFNLVEKGCREQGYYKIYTHIINAVGDWFDADIKNISVPKTDSRAFVEYMLLNGIFGKHDNSILSQLTKIENKDDNIVSKLFFPHVEALKHRYKYLNKFPFLLPVAWIHRFFSAIFRRSFSVSTMVKDTGAAIDYSKVRDDWLKKLDIID